MFYLYFQWMNTRTLVTIDTSERIHVIDVRSEEELDVNKERRKHEIFLVNLLYTNGFFLLV